MRHLDVSGRIACNVDDPYVPSGMKLVGWEDFDDIDCEDCKATIYYESAERLSNEQAYYTRTLMGRKVAGIERIEGTLGDTSELRDDMHPRVRLQKRHASMSPNEKIEALARIHDCVNDSCPSCGGSIFKCDHEDHCLGPDPDKWHETMSDEQVTADLRVLGINVVDALDRFRRFMDDLEKRVLDGTAKDG